MWLYVWLISVFGFGACVGSFLNVAVARLPLNLSVVWPPSRCGKCLTPVRWYDNIPLVSYWCLGGRCRTCGDSFSVRYFLIELTTASLFLLLFWLEVVVNIHGWHDIDQGWGIPHGFYPWEWWLGFLYHSLLFSLVLVAAICDIECHRVPRRLSMVGIVVGLIGAVLISRLGGLDEATLGAPAIGKDLASWRIWGSPTDCLAQDQACQLAFCQSLAGMIPGAAYGLTLFAFRKNDARNERRFDHALLLIMAGCFLGLKLAVAAILIHLLLTKFPRFLQSMPTGVAQGQ